MNPAGRKLFLLLVFISLLPLAQAAQHPLGSKTIAAEDHAIAKQEFKTGAQTITVQLKQESPAQIFKPDGLYVNYLSNDIRCLSGDINAKYARDYVAEYWKAVQTLADAFFYLDKTSLSHEGGTTFSNKLAALTGFYRQLDAALANLQPKILLTKPLPREKSYQTEQSAITAIGRVADEFQTITATSGKTLAEPQKMTFERLLTELSKDYACISPGENLYALYKTNWKNTLDARLAAKPAKEAAAATMPELPVKKIGIIDLTDGYDQLRKEQEFLIKENVKARREEPTFGFKADDTPVIDFEYGPSEIQEGALLRFVVISPVEPIKEETAKKITMNVVLFGDSDRFATIEKVTPLERVSGSSAYAFDVLVKLKTGLLNGGKYPDDIKLQLTVKPDINLPYNWAKRYSWIFSPKFKEETGLSFAELLTNRKYYVDVAFSGHAKMIHAETFDTKDKTIVFISNQFMHEVTVDVCGTTVRLPAKDVTAVKIPKLKKECAVTQNGGEVAKLEPDAAPITLYPASFSPYNPGDQACQSLLTTLQAIGQEYLDARYDQETGVDPASYAALYGTDKLDLGYLVRTSDISYCMKSMPTVFTKVQTLQQGGAWKAAQLESFKANYLALRSSLGEPLEKPFAYARTPSSNDKALEKMLAQGEWQDKVG